jgi:glycosyltransferase involved in cell wall biosynthesis
MKILLVHQNFPGQFKHLVPVLLKDSANQVVAFTMNDYSGPANLIVVRYQASRGTSKEIHPWVAETETKVIRGEAAFRAALKLKQEGFEPDLILAHPGWGESLFLKQVWPKAKMIIYAEFHYASQGTDVGFDPEFSSRDEGDACRVRMKNVNNFLHFDVADGGISPTEWQKSTFPEPFRSKIDVVHDGIDTQKIKPNPNVGLNLGTLQLTRKDEIITFVNRNLEPYRGYHIFMRALPAILKARPNARVIIVGGDGVSYGAAPPAGQTWRQIYLDEVKEQLDMSRVHFVGTLAYEHFIPLLQLSRVHVYLTYPFVLSWSLLEAMACGCAIVASDTAPLQEVIHPETGVLTPFFEPQTLARQVIDLLGDDVKRKQLGIAARKLAIERFDLNTVCIPNIVNIIKRYEPAANVS